MSKFSFSSIVILACLVFGLCSWGFFGHQTIGRYAIFTLPSEMSVFYKKHLNEIVDLSVNADKRRYTDSSEAPRHYIDLDRYGKHPFDSVPQRWKDAVAKFGEDSLKRNGIVPWQIQWSYYHLVEAFKQKDSKKIVQLSADLGHYIADAHVPLHTTENYDGQLSGQKGLHALWESRLPELFAQEYSFYVGKATYIDNPLKTAWQIVKESHLMLDSVLSIDKDLRKHFPPDQIIELNQKGRRIYKNYSLAYANQYHQRLNSMVERRMKAAIKRIGSFWLSAWIDAGQPILNFDKTHQLPPTSTPENDSIFSVGNMIGRSEFYENHE